MIKFLVLLCVACYLGSGKVMAQGFSEAKYKSLYKEHYSCEELKNDHFKDTILFKRLPDSKIVPLFLAKYEKFEVWVEGKLIDYVTEPLKSYIEKSIADNGCEGIYVQSLRTVEQAGVKIVRDAVIDVNSQTTEIVQRRNLNCEEILNIKDTLWIVNTNTKTQLDESGAVICSRPSRKLKPTNEPLYVLCYEKRYVATIVESTKQLVVKSLKENNCKEAIEVIPREEYLKSRQYTRFFDRFQTN